MGECIILKASGGGTTSDEVTTNKSQVLVGTKTITRDSNDEIVDGTMPNRGAWSGNAGMNGSIAVPQGHHDGNGRVNGPVIADRGAWGTDIGVNGRVTIPQGYHNGGGSVGQSIPVQGGSWTLPRPYNQCIVGANRYVNGDIWINGDGNLAAGNIKKGVTLFGVTGNFEGYVVSPTDLYLRGNNIAMFRSSLKTFPVTGSVDVFRFESGMISQIYPGFLATDKGCNIAGYTNLNVECEGYSTTPNSGYAERFLCSFYLDAIINGTYIGSFTTRVGGVNESVSLNSFSIPFNYAATGRIFLKIVAQQQTSPGKFRESDLLRGGKIYRIWFS